jgi:CheY-like chemotaxis protein
MARTVNFARSPIDKLFPSDQRVPGPLKTRPLYIWILIVIAGVAGLSTSIYFYHTVISVITAFSLLFCLSLLFKYLYFNPIWRQIAHVMLIMATLVNFNNAYLALQNINIITIQLILLTILFSFNMLGKEWGLFYSFLNLVPTLVFFVLEYNNNYFVALRSGSVDLSALIISLGVDMILILLLLGKSIRPFFNKLRMKTRVEEEIYLGTTTNMTETIAELMGEKESASYQPDVDLANTLAETEKNPMAENTKGLRLLIAEDNPLNVKLMKKVFAKWDITPTIAENGEKAIEILQYSNFDIILMDLQMPVLDGFGAARGIRKMQDPEKAGIPIIALTAAAFQNLEEQISDAGMNGYLSKPFNPEELMTKINQQLAAC